MCGIAGLLFTGEKAAERVSQNILVDMSERLSHRGPDGFGYWLSSTEEIGLVHRRLAIIDLSEAGAQPMLSRRGRFVIAFNGEIYNHLDIRHELNMNCSGQRWRGHSDTETLLAGIEYWGLAATLKRCFGMFAIAVWDTENRTLSLARDRMGEKPLYMTQIGYQWAFASELSALLPVPGFFNELNYRAVGSQIATGVVPDDDCVFKAVSKVRPGTIVTISAASGEKSVSVYEAFEELMNWGKSRRPSKPLTSHAAADQIEATLNEVIKSQMISDVPLGSFLSGGIDSSLVTALMQANSKRSVKTFSIGFTDAGYDESAHAEVVAKQLGSDHLTFRLSEEDALHIIPDIAKTYSEPFADSSQIPTLLLCREARKHVTVALTGDGGDEVFGGYNRHTLAPKLWACISKTPVFVKRGASFFMQQLNPKSNGLIDYSVRSFGLSPLIFKKMARFGEIVEKSKSLDDVYVCLTQHCDNPSQFLRSQCWQNELVGRLELEGLEPSERLMAFDSVGYLPSDILVKVDRAAMSASLETRAPYLDARTVRAAWSMHLSNRIKDGIGKVVLRDILVRYVPRSLIERPKQGFAVPIDAWLRGPLRLWAENLISKEMIEEFGVLEHQPTQRLWQEHLSGRRNYGNILWSILMLQQWLEQRQGGSGDAPRSERDL